MNINEIDFWVLNLIQENLKCGFLDFVFKYLTHLGDGGIFWTLCGAAMAMSKRYRRCGMTVLFGLLLCLIFGNLLLKPLIARPRPCHINPDVQLLIDMPQDGSFPSGHTYSSFTAAFIVLLNRSRGKFYGRLGAVFLPLASLVAFSRLYLYVHFPSDILGGIALAAAASYLSIVWERRAFRHETP